MLVSDPSISDYCDKENGAYQTCARKKKDAYSCYLQPPIPPVFLYCVLNLKRKKKDKEKKFEIFFLWCLALSGLDIWPEALLQTLDVYATLIFLIEVVHRLTVELY